MSASALEQQFTVFFQGKKLRGKKIDDVTQTKVDEKLIYNHFWEPVP